MPKKSAKPTAADAEVVLHLYDQRMEATMRKARNFMVLEFWPQNYDEFAKLAAAFGTEQQTWLRQVVSYWDQACSLCLRGAVHEDVFIDYAGEAFFLYAKFERFVAQFRKDVNAGFMVNVEKLVTATPERRQRIKNVQATIAKRVAAARAGK